MKTLVEAGVAVLVLVLGCLLGGCAHTAGPAITKLRQDASGRIMYEECQIQTSWTLVGAHDLVFTNCERKVLR